MLGLRGRQNSAVTDGLFLWPPGTPPGWLAHSVWRKGDSAGWAGFHFPASPIKSEAHSRLRGAAWWPHSRVCGRERLCRNALPHLGAGGTTGPGDPTAGPRGPGRLHSVRWDPEAKLFSRRWRPVSDALTSLSLGYNPVKLPNSPPASVLGELGPCLRRGDPGFTPTLRHLGGQSLWNSKRDPDTLR